MTKPQRDMWAEWILNGRFGGDLNRLKSLMEFLYPVRDKVLANARLDAAGRLLDVGCGDGLIGFGALQSFPSLNVIFSDISQDLLDHAEKLAEQLGVAGRSEFVCASANDLSPLPSCSVDAITTRSVLIYVTDKQRAFDEFFRVLKPTGRLSIFEPINRFGFPEPPHLFGGFDVTPVADIAAKVNAFYLSLQPMETDPMLNFDERDLVDFAERAGFREIHLEFQAEVAPKTDADWDGLFRTAWNPKIPPLEQAIQQILTAADREAFVAHLKPLVEAKACGIMKSGSAYLWAAKG